MKNIYYLSKFIVTLPCLGWVPVLSYLLWLNLCLYNYKLGAFIFAVLIAYTWLMWKFYSPTVNLAFIRSAQSPQRFIGVNLAISLTITLTLLLIGMCLWWVLRPSFLWIGNEAFGMQMSEYGEFLWLYFLAYTLFLIGYLTLWEYIRKHRIIRRWTLPNVCW